MVTSALTASPRLLRWLAASLVALPLAAADPARAQRPSLDFPRSGVICDRGSRVCYDSRGVSIGETRRVFGSGAVTNLRRQFDTRTWPTELLFSTGELCDVRRQVCWDDGWQRRNVSKRLSRQLFGNNWNANANNNWNNNWNNNPNNGGWNNGNWNQNPRPGQQLSRCELIQSGRRLFDGECALRQRANANGTAYVVELSDGRRYAFRNRQGQLVLNDSDNIWPAQFYNRGNDLVFRWGNQQLVTRPAYGTGYGLGPNQGPLPWNQPTPSNQFIQDLFNTLFR